MVEVAFSSLADLFRGEDDCAPVYKPGLAVVICDSLDPPPSSSLTVAEALYPELLEIGPRTMAKYAEEIGCDALGAIQKGYELWRAQRAKRVKAVTEGDA